MSFIARRTITTLVPPRIANPSQLTTAPNAVSVNRVMKFYEHLPRGPAPKMEPRGLLQRYQARYFGENESVAPFFHVIGFLLVIGYAQDYYFHLRHHKNNPH
ncbi:MAG: ATP synthase f chain, mitochondrial precursor [Ramalina farinacea]|uniref:ATP synthase f chain, mitochondrial n=1 Tax=Ramalina farinacea TaxID=258253 RepID=A0AA43QJW6_9LECA|nr:ATP synthase f chain, mitochondrial precursor [Ramalina farinacea]